MGTVDTWAPKNGEDAVLFNTQKTNPLQNQQAALAEQTRRQSFPRADQTPRKEKSSYGPQVGKHVFGGSKGPTSIPENQVPRSAKQIAKLNILFALANLILWLTGGPA